MSYYCTECKINHWKGTYYYEQHEKYKGDPGVYNIKADPSIDDGAIVWGDKE